MYYPKVLVQMLRLGLNRKKACKMLIKIRKNLDNNNGSVIVLAIVIIVMIIGVSGMVVDGGLAYAHKLHLQKVVNAAAVSGAQGMNISDEKVLSIAKEIVVANGVDLNQVEFSVYDNKISVKARSERATIFMRLFGNDEVAVAAKATAIRQFGKKNVAPIGMDKSKLPTSLGTNIILKWDEKDVNKVNGWFGILGIDGPGASIYVDSLLEGTETTLITSPASIVNIETGNVATPTRLAVEKLINGSTKPPITACTHDPDLPDPDDPEDIGDWPYDDCVHAMCSRIIIVPIYVPYNPEEDNVLKQVEIVGFAEFFLIETDDKEKTITGTFLREVYPDSADISGYYKIKLIDE